MDKRLVLIVGLLLNLTCTCFAQLSTFVKADSVADLYRGHSLKDLRSLSQKLTVNLSTEEEKFRSIYKWVCSNIATDIELVDLHRVKRKELSGKALDKWNQEINTRMVNLLADERKTLCTGYAWLVRGLSKHSGIRCEIINGYGRRMGSNVGGTGFLNHSWNAVLLNNKWYVCDPAWSAGFVDGPTGTFKFQFEDAYFLADPEVFIRNHYPVDTTWSFVKEVPSLEEFLNGPVIFPGALKYKIQPMSPATITTEITKGEVLSFTFESEHNGRFVFVMGRKMVGPFMKNDRQYTYKHQFRRRGRFSIFLLMDNQLFVGYEVIVR